MTEQVSNYVFMTDEQVDKLIQGTSSKDYTIVSACLKEIYDPLVVQLEKEHKEFVDQLKQRIHELEIEVYEARQTAGYEFIGQKGNIRYYMKEIE
jgi:hypothetical protein